MPSELSRIYPCIISLFHDTVTYGNVETVGVGSCYEVRLYPCSERILPSLEESCHCRQMCLHLSSYGLGPPEEDSHIPEELSRADEYLGKFSVRLLRECLDRHGFRAFRSLTATLDLDVAVVGVRSCRHDSEGHQHIVVVDVLECVEDGFREKIFIIDHMVRRCHHHACVRIAFEKRVGRVCHARCRVAGVWFEKKVSLFEFRYLFLYDVTVPFSRHHEDVLLRHDLEEPLVGRAYECLACVGNIKKLLWPGSLAHRPESCTETSGQNHAVAIFSVHLYEVLCLF